ncbi:DUF4397 domain-containing protein [Natronolimnobius baerhuensis]|uniref:DUF4397 domain-containing protein n=1 Tax=Natronolimnobius baerhuensis TaxID=253108 RepID=A0A202E9F1_9EURY|nr:DUF4397 domain-containing protein [Natronolimnobius baerhuensis]OVE84895.1 hypothetical protein B2G88_11040 [Natronolimnobius baerhuensis]
MTLSRRSTIKTIGIVGAGSALSGTVLGVNEHEDDERDAETVPEDEETGALRVAHFSPDAPNVDVYVNDQRVLADVAYDDVSPYLEIAPGTYSLTITAAGDPDAVVIQQQFAVEDGFYTAAAIGELGAVEEDDDYDDAAADDDYEEDTDEPEHENEDDYNGEDDYDDEDEDEGLETGTFEILLLADRTPEEVEEAVDGEDAGQIRVVHASPDAPAVDIVDSDSLMPIFDDLEFTIPSGYAAAMAGPVTLDIYPAGEAPEPQEGTDLDPEGEAGDDDMIEPGEDDDNDYDDDEAEPVASVEVDVEAWQAYSVYAIGYLEPPETDVDGDGDVDEADDRSFDVVTLLDGVTDEDDEHEDDGEYDAEDEVDEEPVEDDPVDDTDDDYDADDDYDEPDDDEYDDDYDDNGDDYDDDDYDDDDHDDY